MKRNFENTLNQRYSNLLVTKLVGKDNHGRTIAECVCDCGTKKDFPIARVLRGHYKSCGCFRHRSGKQSPTFKGLEELNGTLWSQISLGAIRRGLQMDISIKQAWDIFLKQKRKCALSGLKIVIGNKHLKEETTASLDRIDSSKGYVMGNVQWVHKNINWMKQDFSQSEFINYCKLVTNHT